MKLQTSKREDFTIEAKVEIFDKLHDLAKGIFCDAVRYKWHNEDVKNWFYEFVMEILTPKFKNSEEFLVKFNELVGHNMSIEDFYKKHPSKIEHLPNKSFLAILFPKSVTIPYDDGSTSEDSWDIEVYESESEWVKEVENLSKRKGFDRKEFIPVKIYPANIETKINVSF